jgi:hypothetical protein
MNPNNILIMIAATITAITVIAVGLRKASLLVKKFIHFLDDYFGEEARPGFDGRPGMQERMRNIEEELKCVAYEMKPNSGSSIKDAIGRIEKRLDALEQK